MSNVLKKGDYGNTIVATVVDEDDIVDLTAATSIVFKFRKPSGTTLEKTGALFTDGSDGKVKYVTASGDIDESGTWRFEVVVNINGGKFTSVEPSVFYVEKNI
jgi:hypothetical protein